MTLIVLICAVLPVQAFALEVQSVRFGAHESKTRLVLDLDRAAEFRTFVLSDPYRLALDLPDFKWTAGNAVTPKSVGVIATRHGDLENGISRIVFDMDQPLIIKAAFTLPAGGGKGNRLVIDFTNASTSLFKQNKDQVFGTLNNARGGVGVLKVPEGAVKKEAVIQKIPEREPEKKAEPEPPKVAVAKSYGQKPVIVIDPGHGGIDPGAVGERKVLEKDIVLAMAKELKKQLEYSGKYRVKLTRNGDTFIKLKDRVQFARKANADLFISIHADSLPESDARGASIYTLSETASDKQSALLAAKENKADLIAGIDLSVEDKDVADILMDLAMRETMNQSKFFANTMVDNFKASNIYMLNNPHRYAGFAVLKAPDVPSILVETGFMSNDSDARLLNTSSHRKKVAKAFKKGIDRYFEQVRKNQRL